jgi:uncharacterized membrane protein YhaH (DUF805 family)
LTPYGASLGIVMTSMRFLLSQTGRIGRVHYCFGLLTFLGINAAVLLVALGLPMSVGVKPFEFATQAIAMAWLAIFFIAGAAMMNLGVRRLHDRGKGGLWLFVFYVLPALIIVLGDETAPVEWHRNAAALALALWGLVELCCLPGTAGENKYGPDPRGSGGGLQLNRPTSV